MNSLTKGITIKAGEVEITTGEFVEALFREYYGVLLDMEAEPSAACYSIAGVEGDLLMVLEGKLSTMDTPFSERFALRVRANNQRMISLQDGA